MPNRTRRIVHARVWIWPAFVVWVLVLGAAPTARADDRSDQIDRLLARYQALGLFNGSALVADSGLVQRYKGAQRR
jgi:hypothetical protein